MTRSRVPLSLHADRCDRCGRCLAACERGALKVGVNYVFVDWRVCDGCLACVDACQRGAIQGRGEPAAESTHAVGGRPSGGTAGKATGGPPAWSLLEGWTMLVLLVALFIGKDAVLTSAAVRGLSSEGAVFARVGVLFAFYSVQVLALWMLAWRRGLHVSDAFGLRVAGARWREWVGSTALVVGLLVVVRLGAWAYGVTVQALGWDPPVPEVSDLTEVFGPTIWGLLLSVVLVVLVAPVVEEVVFRGVLQGAIAGEWGIRTGIVVSAAIFSFYHLTPWLFVPLFALGVACGWLAHTRRSLMPAIALHAAYNVVPVVMAFYLVW